MSGLNNKILAGKDGVLTSSIDKYEAISELARKYDD